ncbi:MAG: hypothetical protein WCJ35_08820 [Planctomycetota bacterium]
MRYIRHCVVIICVAITRLSPLLAASDNTETYTFASQRQVGHIDHVNILLEASGDVLTKSGTSEKPERLEVGLTCRRDYDEKTLEIPTTSEKTLRSVRYYHEASATLRKGTVAQTPALRPESQIIGVEIVGGKSTLFSPKGPFSMDELELVTAVGESLCLDQLLPGNPVKIGSLWRISDDTIALLLGLDEVTSNSVQMALNEVTPEFARFELVGQVEGKLFGASNQINLKAKCRFDRQTGRIDWFAMRLKQNRDIGVVEDGLDATVLVQAKITRLEIAEKLSDAVLADLSLKLTDERMLVRYLQSGGGCQLTHDRSWFLIDRTRDQDEFHRLDRGQDIGLCKISPQPQVHVSNLPSLEQFQGIVQKLLGTNLAEFSELSQVETPAHLRILRVKAKGKDNAVPVGWFYYLVSDPEGRQVMFAFRVEEKRLAAFGRADEQLVHSLRFVEKKDPGSK